MTRPPSPHRRGIWRPVVLAILAAVLAVGWGAVPAHADDPESWVSVTLDSLSPSVPGPDGTVVIKGHVTNTSTTTLYNVQALICRDWRAPIADGQQLASVLASNAEQPPCYRIVVAGTFQQLTRGTDPATKNLPPVLEPGASLRFTVQATVGQFTFAGGPGIYLVGVHLMGRLATMQAKDQVLGRTRTFLPVGVSKTKPRTPTQVASLVVLSTRPDLIRDGVFSDDALARAIGPDGELGRLMALSDDDHYTFLVDPAVVSSVRMLAKGYHVQDADGKLTSRPPSPAARAWLDRLAAIAPDRLFQMPYANPDLAALAHTGHSDLYEPGLAADVLPGIDTLVLPAGGFADSATMALASTGDVAAVLISRQGSSATAALSSGPDGVPIISYAADAMDGGPGPDPRTTPTQIRQRFLADTFLDAATGSGTALVRVITTARQAEALPSAEASWLRTTTIHDLLQGTPAPEPVPLTYPDSAAAAELAPKLIADAADLATDYGTYAELVSQTATTSTAGQLAVARAVSADWRGDPAALRAYLRPQERDLAAILHGSKLHLGKHSNVVLSGKKGPTSVTIVNDLDVAVHVGVHFTSGNAQRLAVKDLPTKQIPAHSTQSIVVEMQPKANGEVPVSAQLVTAAGSPIGKPVSFIVHATRYGFVGWVIAIGAGVVLFVSTFLRIRQVRREKAGAEGDDSP